jgi:hypothetical protein
MLPAQETGMTQGMQGMPIKEKKGGVSSGHRHVAMVPVQTPDVPDLPFRMDGNVKEFHLIAEPVK